MTPMFDEFDKKLREALASGALPPDGFADRVMARVAETPQQKKTPSPARPALAAVRRCLPCGGCGADPAAAQRRSGQQECQWHGGGYRR